MGSSKRRLIDADRLKAAFEEIAEYPMTAGWYSQPKYFDDPISEAIYQRLQEVEMRIYNDMTTSFSRVLEQLAQKIEECTYEDYPCLLCRDDDNMSNPIEDFGDIRMPKIDEK